jgi:hypothetical protein
MDFRRVLSGKMKCDDAARGEERGGTPDGSQRLLYVDDQLPSLR